MGGLEYDWERIAETWLKADCVRSGQVGPMMVPSEEHLLCEEFVTLHADSFDFLFEKLSDANPYVADYAFKCLTRIREIAMEEVPHPILHRSDPIHTQWGCVVREDTLGSFIRGYWGFEDPDPLPPTKRYLP